MYFTVKDITKKTFTEKFKNYFMHFLKKKIIKFERDVKNFKHNEIQ